MGGANYNCCTLILAKDWTRLFDEPWATKQRWYCRSCGAGYKTKYGMMLEILTHGTAHYARVEIPPNDIFDVNIMAVQRRSGKVETPAQLYDALPLAKPRDREVFLTRRGDLGEGVYTFDEKLFLALEEFSWDQLYNLTRGRPRPPPAAAAVVAHGPLAGLPIEEC